MENVSPEFAKALVLVQGSLEEAKKDKSNPAFRSKYADLGSCWDACRDALQGNNIAVLQLPTTSPPGYVGLETRLIYGSTGESISSTFTVPLKDATNAQALGSSLTYARRYALCSFLGICGEDDDGDKASKPAPAQAAQRRTDSAPTAQTVQSYTATFESKTSADAMKAVYSEVKNSGLEEPHKTALLKKMADAIKARRAEETK